MGNVRISEGMTRENFQKVVEWVNSEGRDFLRQFVGDKISFPIQNSEMLTNVEATYSIFYDDEFVGMLQIIWKKERNVHIGRFIIGPEYNGKGIGTRALDAFCRQIFNDSDFDSISLNVYKFNTLAQRLYKSCGFEVTSEDLGNDPWSNIRMKKIRQGQGC